MLINEFHFTVRNEKHFKHALIIYEKLIFLGFEITFAFPAAIKTTDHVAVKLFTSCISYYVCRDS